MFWNKIQRTGRGRNEALQDQEEALPTRESVVEVKRAGNRCNASSGVGAHVIHPEVPLDLHTERYKEIVLFLAQVKKCGIANQHALLLTSNNVTSERPIALLPTLIQW